MPNPELKQIFKENQLHISTPDSTLRHGWKRNATALIGLPLWTSKVASLVQPEITQYYLRYKNLREYQQWLEKQIDRHNPDDRTLSAVTQLYALKEAPEGEIVILGSGFGFNTALLVGANITNNPLTATTTEVSASSKESSFVRKMKPEDRRNTDCVYGDFMSIFEHLEDNSLAAVVLDWNLSRIVNPRELFRLIYRKLKPNGIYVHTDRKPFEDLVANDKTFNAEGFAVVLEQRELDNQEGGKDTFIVPKIFLKDLSQALTEDGFQVMFSSKIKQDCIYDIALTRKSSEPIKAVSIEEIIDSTWNNLQLARKKLAEIVT